MFFFLDSALYSYFFLFVGVILSLSSVAVIGVFNSLQKKELIGDVIAHSFLPGVALSFLFTGLKATFSLMVGCFVTGMMAIFLIDYLPKYSKLKKDSAMSLVLSISFGFGLMLFSYIQHSGTMGHAGLKNFLLGNVASLTNDDIVIFVLFSLLLFLSTLLFFKAWQLLSFDPHFATAIGWPVHRLQWFFQALTVWMIVLGVQTMGIILVEAILVIPAVTAGFWTKRLRTMLVVASFFATVSGVIGIVLSYHIPGLPTGPSIVLVLALLAFSSFAFAPIQGIIAKKFRKYRFHRKVWQENVLKLFYELGDDDGDYFRPRTLNALLARRPMDRGQLQLTIGSLEQQNFLIQKGGHWVLTVEGKEKGGDILRLHLLWEAYLKRFLKIEPSGVHHDAEAIEHLITPQMARLLQNSLKLPKVKE